MFLHPQCANFISDLLWVLELVCEKVPSDSGFALRANAAAAAVAGVTSPDNRATVKVAALRLQPLKSAREPGCVFSSGGALDFRLPVGRLESVSAV